MGSGGSKLLPVDAKRLLTLLRMASLADRGRVRRETGTNSDERRLDDPESVMAEIWTRLVVVYTEGLRRDVHKPQKVQTPEGFTRKSLW
jgi:hypothetical protein